MLLDRSLKNHPESKKYRNRKYNKKKNELQRISIELYYPIQRNSRKKMEQRKVKGQNYQRNNRRQFCQDSRIT